MADAKTPQGNPDPSTLPGEVERDNNALRPNEPGKEPLDPTAQSLGKEETRRQQERVRKKTPGQQGS
jgi:hypothetical protein